MPRSLWDAEPNLRANWARKKAEDADEQLSRLLDQLGLGIEGQEDQR
jgi:hypothetical protein